MAHTLMHTVKTAPKGAIFIKMGDERDPIWLCPCAIPNVYVQGGLNFVGDAWLEFNDLRGMHNAIADEALKGAISGPIFTYLRKELLLTSAEASALVNADPAAVSAWESGSGFAVEGAAEKLRALYAAWRASGKRPVAPTGAAAAA